jgi:hypothetical protein
VVGRELKYAWNKDVLVPIEVKTYKKYPKEVE